MAKPLMSCGDTWQVTNDRSQKKRREVYYNDKIKTTESIWNKFLWDQKSANPCRTKKEPRMSLHKTQRNLYYIHRKKRNIPAVIENFLLFGQSVKNNF